MADKMLTCCGTKFANGGALASHRRSKAHQKNLEATVAASEELTKERAPIELEPLEADEFVEDRAAEAKAKTVGRQGVPGADLSADIAAEIARGEGEYKGIDPDDYGAALMRDGKRLDNDDLDVRETTLRDRREAPPRGARGSADEEFAFDRQVETDDGERDERRIKDAPGSFPEREYGKEALERLRRGDSFEPGISNERERDEAAMRHSDEEFVGRRARRSASPEDPEDRRDEYDEQVGDSAKKLDAVFDWCLDYRGARHRFSRFYYRKGFLLDFYRRDDEDSRREVADKARQIASRNLDRPRSQHVGYIAAVVGTPLRYEDLARGMNGEVVPRLRDHLPNEGERIGPERTVDVDQFSFRRDEVQPARFRDERESADVRPSRPQDPNAVAVTIDGVQYMVPRAVAEGFTALAERAHEGERIAKATL